MRDQIAEAQQISDEERLVLLKGVAPCFDNLVAWARFYLVKAGYIDSSRRGVWTLTEKGCAIPTLTHDEAIELFQRHQGVMITIGSFTTEARKETIRDGVPPIEMVDGEKLIEMLESLELLQHESLFGHFVC